MKTNLITVITNLFNASADAHKAIAAALPSMKDRERKVFIREAAAAVAKAASIKYGEAIREYDGQRGVAFGVWNGAKWERTVACDATRKWFSYNVVSYFQKADEPVKPANKVWESIVSELAEAKKIGKNLKGEAQRSFKRELADLIARYAD